MLASANVSAGAWTPEAGGGTVSLAYQYSHVQNHLSAKGKQIDAGSINSNSALLQVSYGVTDHLAVTASIPYIEKKYNGKGPHTISDGHGGVRVSPEDNGDYHGGFQDFALGVQYQMNWGRWAISPFSAYSSPTHDYEHFAHAAVGSKQRKFTFGVDTATILPAPLDPFYLQVGADYSWYQKFEGVSVGRGTLTIEIGCVVTDRLQMRVFSIGQKTFGGLEFPEDFVPVATHRGLFYHHDQVQRVDYVDGGLGASFALTGDTDVFFQYLKTFWGENGHETEFLLSAGISRSF